MLSWKHLVSLMWPSFSSSVLELDWCLSWVVQLDWMILLGSDVHLDWSCACWTRVVEKMWQCCACWTGVAEKVWQCCTCCTGMVHLGWMRSACWSSMVRLGWMRNACWSGIMGMAEEMHKEWRCACWTGMIQMAEVVQMGWLSLVELELVLLADCYWGRFCIYWSTNRKSTFIDM